MRSAVVNTHVAAVGALAIGDRMVSTFSEGAVRVPEKLLVGVNVSVCAPPPALKKTPHTWLEPVNALPMVALPQLGCSDPAERVMLNWSTHHAPIGAMSDVVSVPIPVVAVAVAVPAAIAHPVPATQPLAIVVSPI